MTAGASRPHVQRVEPTLQRRHFAFMRALLQGLDERESWSRYLAREGETADIRVVRHTIAWIRDAFAAAARREARPGTARLVRLDPQRFADSKPLPSLEEFAAEQGLEDFSAAEQAEAYAAAFQEERASGGGRRVLERPAQRARVIARQLEALRWLEDHAAPEPRLTDAVGAWLNPTVARRLSGAGVATLAELVTLINREGARWWRAVPGVGATKAARVLSWLQAQDPALGLCPQAHALLPFGAIPREVLASVVPPGQTLLPLEKFRPPPELSGIAGTNRAPVSSCTIAARSDIHAIHAWLEAKAPAAARPNPGATARAYRKEAERLLLWSVLERRCALSSLQTDDALAFEQFLRDPPPGWCGARHHQRWSAKWRPLEGALSDAALLRAIVVVHGLCAWLVACGYLRTNPFARVVPRRQPRRLPPVSRPP